MAEPVDAPIPRSDSRDVDLQPQIDDLSLALQEWRRTRDFSPAAEERLVQITFQCARMVESWEQLERSRIAVAGPERPDAVERLHQATGERLRALERHIEHEWDALPDARNRPGKRPNGEDKHPAAVAPGAAPMALRGFAGVESRLAALEEDLQAGMAQLSRELQTVVTELRQARSQPPSAPPAPAFPLESVMRIHEELRESAKTDAPAPDAIAAAAPRALPQGPETALALTARVESLERAVATATEAAPPPRRGWGALGMVFVAAVALAGLTFFGLWMQRRVDARLDDAALRISEAERQRDATIAATREEAERQVADARQTAAQAQIVSNVLAAPDLVRYWLTGPGGDATAYGQVLFSRSRGLVFSATRLDPPGSGQTYQLWLLTRGGPVNAALIAPDSAGRVTHATDVPLTVQGRLTGAILTVAPAGGGADPSDGRVLLRVE